MDTLMKWCSPNRQWRSADANRCSSVCQRVGNILDNESPRVHASSIIARKALRWKRILLWVDEWSLRTGFGDSETTDNFVPIVFPGLSASSSSRSDPSTWMTVSSHESHCSTSFSSSSSSSTVSDTKTREREDRIEIDTSTVTMTTRVGDRSGQPDETQANKTQNETKQKGNHDRTRRPVVLWDPRVAARIQGKCGGWRNSWTWRLTRQFLSRSVFRTYIPETWGFVQTQCLYSLPKRPQLWDLEKDQNYEGPMQNTQKWSCTSCWKILVMWACKSYSNPTGILKSFTLTIPWSSAKLVQISPGIIVRQYHTDQRQMGLLKEQCPE